MDSPMSEQFNELVVSPPSEAFEPSEPDAENTFQIFVAGPEKTFVFLVEILDLWQDKH